MEPKIVIDKKRRAAHSRSNNVSTAKLSSSGFYLEPKKREIEGERSETQNTERDKMGTMLHIDGEWGVPTIQHT